MANKEVTLKRYDGSQPVDLFPTTTMNQVQVSTTDATSITDFLVTNYINTNKLGAASGVATLDSNQKLTLSQLPSGIGGGLKFAGTLTQAEVTSDGVALAEKIDAVHQSVGIFNGFGLEGHYFVATEEVTFVNSPDSVQAGSTGRYYAWLQQDPNEEGVTGGDVDTIKLEVGDWLLISNIDGSGIQGFPFFIKFATINNTYGNASNEEFGIVKLSESTDTTGTTSKVITESVLGGMIGTAADTIAAGDHLHDDRYYTETEVQGFFDGTTTITGYEKQNWDKAYNEKINSATFNAVDGVVTLTREDTTTVTVNLDGRYVETVNAGQVDTTDGIDVSNTGTTFTVSHHDTSSIADTSNTEGTVIQNATFDTYGHILTQSSVNLDGRYYTETEINNWINGTAQINDNSYTPIIYGAAPSSEIEGAILIDED